MKTCTSIEQSKKLIELGIDENTSDMVYLKSHFEDAEEYSLLVGSYHEGYAEKDDSLEKAESLIHLSLKDYYTFSEKDIDNLCKKIDKRESEFVRSLIDELNRHRCNAYCEMGITDEMLFKF